jgi:hypothetical protein
VKRIIGLGFGVVFLAALAWIAYWIIGAEGQRNAFDLWLEKQRARGWQAEAATIDMTGFPGAFQLTVTDLRLADPRNDWSWSAPVLKAESASSAPTRIAVDWPDTQTIGTTEDQITVSAGKLATLLDLRPGPSMELREAATDATGLVLKARSGWVGSAKALDLQVIERSEDTAPPNSYNLRGTAQGVKLPKELLKDLDPTGLLKPQVDTLTLVGHAALDAPIDRRTLEESALAIRAASIREAGFAWGDMKLVIKGAFQVDDAGYPVGKINIEAQQWQKIVDLATKSGVIDKDMAETITGAVKLVTALSGGGDNLKLPLRLKGGEVRLGPIAIAEAPRLAPPR